jgi:hypothetical protein
MWKELIDMYNDKSDKKFRDRIHEERMRANHQVVLEMIRI